MRLTAGQSYAFAAGGRWHDVHVDGDGTARCATGRLQFDADGNLTDITSEPAPARADDGARVEAAAACAKEGHGWSVSATRTIGNVALFDAYREVYGRAADAYMQSLVYGGPLLSAADLDAVRDEPVMPDETPLADMAKPDEAMAVKRAWYAMGVDLGVHDPTTAWVRFDGNTMTVIDDPSPLVPPVLPRDPSPGVCPSCGTQRRERGEERTRVWRCGCCVKPESVYRHDVMRWAGRGYITESLWHAKGHGIEVDHPTEAGAVSAWREALANAQREEDAK
jgi:hypothetical protein